MNTFNINEKKFYSSFTILYPWFNNFTIVQYKNYPKKFLVRRRYYGNNNKQIRNYSIINLSSSTQVRVKNHRNKISSYRVVASVMISSELPSGSEVHHIDHNHDNNNPDNLLIVTHEQHILLHKKLRESIAKYYNKNSINGFIEYQLLVESIKNNMTKL